MSISKKKSNNATKISRLICTKIWIGYGDKKIALSRGVQGGPPWVDKRRKIDPKWGSEIEATLSHLLEQVFKTIWFETYTIIQQMWRGFMRKRNCSNVLFVLLSLHWSKVDRYSLIYFWDSKSFSLWFRKQSQGSLSTYFQVIQIGNNFSYFG